MLRGRAMNRVSNDREELNLHIDLPVISSVRTVVDQSARTPGRPLAAEPNPESSRVGRPAWSKPSTISLQQLNTHTPREDSNEPGQCEVHGRRVFVDGRLRQQPSLPRQMALRRNRSEKSAIIRGLPSKTLQTRRQSTSQSSQLPEVSQKLIQVGPDSPLTRLHTANMVYNMVITLTGMF